MSEYQCCNTCLQKNIVFSVTNVYRDAISYVELLKFIVPEVEWNFSCYICDLCIKNLEIAYRFKEICLNSISALKSSNKIQDIHISHADESGSISNRTTHYSTENNTEEESDNEYLNDHNSIDNREHVKDVELQEFAAIEYQGKQVFKDETCIEGVVKHQCDLCQESFQDKHELKKHKQSHKYSCDKCSKSYSSNAVLKKHVLVKHTEKSSWNYNCWYCSETFPTKAHLLSHSKKLHVTDETFICFHCSNRFNDKNILLEHISEHHINNEANVLESNTKFSIKTADSTGKKQSCDKLKTEAAHTYQDHHDSVPDNSKSVQNRNKHEIVTSKPGRKKPCRTFPCDSCDKILTSSVKLINHCVMEHNADPKSIKPFACDQCEKKFATSTILFEHKRYHTRTRQNMCSFCGKGFVTKNDLNCHEYIHYNERSFKCEICLKGFNTHKNLRTHRIIKHSDPMTWKHCCPICNKRFAISSNYKVHVKRHMGDKQFCCHLCVKKFVNKDELRQHIESHSNIREYKCQHCEKEYKKKRIYEMHLTKAHGIGNAKIPKKEKKHFCHLCPKSYFDKNKLTKHLMTHSGIKPFCCEFCNKRFTDRYYLKQHKKTSHASFDITDVAA